MNHVRYLDAALERIRILDAKEIYQLYYPNRTAETPSASTVLGGGGVESQVDTRAYAQADDVPAIWARRDKTGDYTLASSRSSARPAPTNPSFAASEEEE